MPIINVTMDEGSTIEQKRELVKDMTESVVKSLGVKPDRVRIIISEFPKTNFAVAGVLISDKKE
jgi:4-oxalocrotonate tautomerase